MSSEPTTPMQPEWVHASTLRSIANSIEPLFADAADTLRGIAREGGERINPEAALEVWHEGNVVALRAALTERDAEHDAHREE